MNNLKIYQDSKELPFWNYKRIIQTGDFLYMVKGYDSGDSIEADFKKLEDKFNEVVQDYVLSMNTKTEELDHIGKYMVSNNEINKLLIIVRVIDLVIKRNQLLEQLGLEVEDTTEINELLEGVKIERSEDLLKQKDIILSKINKYKNDLESAKTKIEKQEKTSDQLDLDEQYMNVCLGLEMQYDEKKISLYQYGIMIKMLLKKIESFNKVSK